MNVSSHNIGMDCDIYLLSTSLESGSMKENTLGFCFSGFLIMMLIPRFMKGVEKSTTRSLTDVIVRSPIAISALCNHSVVYLNCWSHPTYTSTAGHAPTYTSTVNHAPSTN